MKTSFQNYGAQRVKTLIMQLATARVLICLYLVSSYMSNPSHISFLSYFASTTPDSTHKHLRLKTIICLAGSTLYDPTAIYSQILAQRNILKLELAIIEGMVRFFCRLHTRFDLRNSELQLGNHGSALTTLARELHDHTTAEAYCMLGGVVVSPRTAQSVAETNPGLEQWVSVLFGAAKPTSKLALHSGEPLSSNELKRKLLKMLLGVYMSSG